MRCVGVFVALSSGLASPARADDVELRWGEFGYYSTWQRHAYEIESDFQFVSRLPSLDEFPLLLEAAESPGLDGGDREVALSQLRTLSRCDFVPGHRSELTGRAKYLDAIEGWKRWWSSVGTKQVEDLRTRGKRYPSAWREIAPSHHLACPDYPIVLPSRWTSTLKFQSGDYDGYTEEIIEFRVADDDCGLVRRYATGFPHEAEWTHEAWEGFSREEADRFIAVLHYAIDHPWFFGDDPEAEPDVGKEGGESRHIRGRPKAWTDYYASDEWTGIQAEDGSVVFNHDPAHWYSLNYEMAGVTELDGALGVVFRVVRDLFPDPSWGGEVSRWVRVEAKE